jgi:hypothetical protein
MFTHCSIAEIFNCEEPTISFNFILLLHSGRANHVLRNKFTDPGYRMCQV